MLKSTFSSRFDLDGVWKVLHERYNHWSFNVFTEYWEVMSPEEIESILIKKLEVDGLKVGCMVDDEENLTHTIKYLKFDYYQFEDELWCCGALVYSKGKFAKIIPQEEKSVAFAHPMSEESTKSQSVFEKMLQEVREWDKEWSYYDRKMSTKKPKDAKEFAEELSKKYNLSHVG